MILNKPVKGILQILFNNMSAEDAIKLCERDLSNLSRDIDDILSEL